MAAADAEEVRMKPYVLGLEEGQAIWMFDALDTIKADAERMGGGLALWSSSTSGSLWAGNRVRAGTLSPARR